MATLMSGGFGLTGPYKYFSKVKATPDYSTFAASPLASGLQQKQVYQQPNQQNLAGYGVNNSYTAPYAKTQYNPARAPNYDPRNGNPMVMAQSDPRLAASGNLNYVKPIRRNVTGFLNSPIEGVGTTDILNRIGNNDLINAYSELQRGKGNPEDFYTLLKTIPQEKLDQAYNDAYIANVKRRQHGMSLLSMLALGAISGGAGFLAGSVPFTLAKGALSAGQGLS